MAPALRHSLTEAGKVRRGSHFYLHCFLASVSKPQITQLLRRDRRFLEATCRGARRATLTRLLADKYEELMATGWRVSRGEVRRDVQRLLGGAYEEFLCKTL